jgi:hypothetical protein
MPSLWGARLKKNPRLGTRDQPRQGRERSRSHTPTHWQVEGLGGPLYTCLRRAGGRGDNSVGYPTVPRRRTEQVVPFLPLPPSTRFARCACARKHAPTRTPPIAGRAMQAPAKLQARVWTEAYNLTYASTGLRILQMLQFSAIRGRPQRFFPYLRRSLPIKFPEAHPNRALHAVPHAR